jgi:anhydro-N-acetylmuramic acid kinase
MTVAMAQAHMPDAPRLWIVCGGGRKNPALMRMLGERIAAEVVTAEAAGFDGDSVEAEAWAFMAVRSLRGLPLSFPGTTGVEQPACGGVRADPAKA